MDWQEPKGWPEDAMRNRLIGDWHLYQRKSGHRTSTDDLITAWYATHRCQRQPATYLDLGTGVGSVMLMVAHKLRPSRALGIEAQAQSVAMAQRAIDELPSHPTKIQIQHADFREAEFGDRKFQLVTGSPPYFPLDAGILPTDAQRRACRFEARGGVEVYCETAAKAMSERASFYLVFQTRWTERVLQAAGNCGLHLTGQADFLMRRDREEPFLSVYEFAREAVAAPHRVRCPVRESNGDITPDYQEIRVELGVSEATESPRS